MLLHQIIRRMRDAYQLQRCYFTIKIFYMYSNYFVEKTALNQEIKLIIQVLQCWELGVVYGQTCEYGEISWEKTTNCHLRHPITGSGEGLTLGQRRGGDPCRPILALCRKLVTFYEDPMQSCSVTTPNRTVLRMRTFQVKFSAMVEGTSNVQSAPPQSLNYPHQSYTIQYTHLHILHRIYIDFVTQLRVFIYPAHITYSTFCTISLTIHICTLQHMLHIRVHIVIHVSHIHMRYIFLLSETAGCRFLNFQNTNNSAKIRPNSKPLLGMSTGTRQSR